MRRHSTRAPAALALAVCGALAGCSASPSPTTTSTAPGSTRQQTQQTAMTLTFTRPDGTLGDAQRSIVTGTGPQSAPRAAMEALVAGPDGAERAAGLSTEVPSSTVVHSLGVQNGQATLDLGAGFVSSATAGGPTALPTAVAQIVFTLTQFSSVQQVAFRLDGAVPSPSDEAAGLPAQPATRANEFTYLPPIFVEQPAVDGSASQGKLRVEGLADVFEAQFRVQLVDAAGSVLVDEPVHANAGSGTWGEFDTTFDFPAGHPGPGKLVVFALSAKDGSRVDEVDIPLTIDP